MKKLEKMDGKLFESLKPNEMSNLAALLGGDAVRIETTGERQAGCQDVEYVSQTGPNEFPTADINLIDSDWANDMVAPLEQFHLILEKANLRIYQ
jgi:hypothetical protein